MSSSLFLSSSGSCHPYSLQMEAVLKEMQEDIDVLTTWCQNLIQLQKLLRQQTDVFYQKCFQVCCGIYVYQILFANIISVAYLPTQSSQAELHVSMVSLPAGKSLPESPASTDTRPPTIPKRKRIKVSIYFHIIQSLIFHNLMYKNLDVISISALAVISATTLLNVSPHDVLETHLVV